MNFRNRFFEIALLVIATLFANQIALQAQISPRKPRTLFLRWVEISTSEWGMTYVFQENNGKEFRVSEINIPDFSEDNNTYFTRSQVEGTVFSKYKLKEGIAGKWFEVKVSSVEKENANSGEMVNVDTIISMKESLCESTALITEDDPNGPGITNFDCPGIVSVHASIELAALGTNNYKVSNVLDDNNATAWSTKGSGVGQWIEFTITSDHYPSVGQSFQIMNGYNKNKTLWKANSRVKKVRVEVNGKPTCRITLLDTDSYQHFSIGYDDFTKKGFRVRFVIEEIYKGEKYEDTLISYFVPQGNCG